MAWITFSILSTGSQVHVLVDKHCIQLVVHLRGTAQDPEVIRITASHQGIPVILCVKVEDK